MSPLMQLRSLTLATSGEEIENNSHGAATRPTLAGEQMNGLAGTAAPPWTPGHRSVARGETEVSDRRPAQTLCHLVTISRW